ncbi:RICIN domain-containing protein [Actinoallomurus purpureus]|uniref:RICIN domain-containing protein n=1 Tax=Actinoallomurus purpureus TaxID=478114 RepID=UPI002092573A|nr:RICIN domain-containing protein [Actinoallomurus purpureus]MCO6008472.1 RICIN domain-containing protein [Actinoallomurus purpureus]
MSSQSESGEPTKSLGVRRPVKLPEADIDAAEDLAPASGPTSVDEPAPASDPASAEEQAPASASTPAEEQTPASESTSERGDDQPASAGGETADAGEAAPEEEGSGGAQEPAASPDEATKPAADDKAPEEDGKKDDKAAKKEKRTAWLRNVAVAPASPDGAAAAGDEMPPDRPRKPVLAAVAIGGVVLLAIPILLVGTESHGGRKQRTTAAADRVMTDGQGAAGAYASASPTVTASPSPSASASPKKGTKAGEPVSKAIAGKHGTQAGKGKVGVTGGGGRGPTGPKFSTTTRVLLHNTMTGLCADVPGYGNGSIEGPINQFTCTRSDSDNQLWDLVVNMKGRGPHGADLFTIRNSKDNYCFDVPGAGPAPARTALSENLCYPGLSDNQMWYLDKRSSGHFWIRNYVSHKLCLDVSGDYGSGGKDARLTLFPCDPKDDHIWTFG